MHISFSPFRSDASLVLERQGETLLVNGRAFDFGDLPDGDVWPETDLDSAWLVGPVRREGGALHLEIRLPHGPDASRARRFPAPVRVDQDGPVPLPD